MRPTVVIAAGILALPLGVGAARADDLVIGAPAPIWSGLYVGGHGGWGFGEADFKGSPQSGVGGTLDLDGAAGGVQVGYGVLTGPWYFGIEGDYTLVDADGSESATVDVGFARFTTTVENELDYLASIRGRLGYAFGSWLVYGTGGAAWTDYELGTRITVAGVSSSASAHDSTTGFVVGGGVQAMVHPGVGGRLEVLHYDFSDISVGSGSSRIEIDADQTVVRAGFDLSLDALVRAK